MSKNIDIIRFQDNVPVIVRFNFSYPIPKNGRYGMQFFYGVKNDMGREAGFYATEKLHNILQVVGSVVGNLKGCQLEIEKKITDGGKSFWKIYEKEEDITPSESQIKDYVESLGKKDEVQDAIDDLKIRVYDLEKIVKNLSGGIC
ncbi:MAG: hypothetical protein PHP25_01315 [Candidatus Moranbacteria bacterium]|nr:hypothetical protein [Candidatus Moranbacteria bacterium]